MEINFLQLPVNLYITDLHLFNYYILFIAGSKPFVLTVVTNDNDMDDVGNRGFALDYSQQACSISRFGTTAVTGR